MSSHFLLSLLRDVTAQLFPEKNHGILQCQPLPNFTGLIRPTSSDAVDSTPATRHFCQSVHSNFHQSPCVSFSEAVVLFFLKKKTAAFCPVSFPTGYFNVSLRALRTTANLQHAPIFHVPAALEISVNRTTH